MSNNEFISIGRERAVALFEARHWEGMTMRERAEFQLFTDELTMPFDVFHEALEAALGRPVWTHELGLNRDGLAHELRGEQDSPTFEEVMNLIPEDKRVVVILGGQEARS